MTIFLNDSFIPKEDAKISPDDRGFIFGDGVYEVIRSYNGRLFRAESHFKRLARSLEEIRIRTVKTSEVSETSEVSSLVKIEELKDIVKRLIKDNHLEKGDAKVYIQITRGAAPRNHAFPENTLPTVYACASPFEPPLKKWKEGIKVILVPDIRWARCDIKTTGLLPNILANQQAKDKGADEAIFVRNGTVTEGSLTNFCAVFNGVLTTFPESSYILSGITRSVVLELCRDFAIPVREFPVFEKDLDKADECMVVGTTAEVMPVVQINDRIVGNGKPGAITLRLQRAFKEITG